MAMPTLPSGWDNFSAAQKINWFNQNGVTADELRAVGVDQGTLDYMFANGYTGGAPVETEATVTRPRETVSQDTAQTVTQTPAAQESIQVGGATLPSGWDNFSPTQKINWFNQNGITPEQLREVGVGDDDINYMRSAGYTVGAPAATPDTTQPTGGITLPDGWSDFSAAQKINWFNQNGITPEQLREAGVDQGTIDYMHDAGYTVGSPSPVSDTVQAAGGTDTVQAAGGTDTVVASGDADTVKAGGGADTVVAGGGADTVEAGGGTDTVTAAGGNDTVSATTTWTSPTGITIQVPAGWENFTGQQKVDWFKSKNMTGSTLQALGIPATDIAGAIKLGLPSGASANFDTTVRGAPTTDRVGTGVAVTGESGLREGYAPYVQRLLERASAEADVPFQKYTGTSPLLESAKAGIANLTTPAQFLQGSNLAQAAGQGALEYGKYMPTAFTTGTFATPTSQVQTQGSPEEVKTDAVPKAQGGLMSLVGYDAGGAVDVGVNVPNMDGVYSHNVDDPNSRAHSANAVNNTTSSAQSATPNSYTVPANPNIQPTTYGGQNVTNVQASYMSPYMQNVVDVQQREAKRQADIANQAIGAKAAQAGAFGGSRHGLLESEANRNLMTQLGGIQAKGLQDAYTQGLGQFNIEQNRGLEAQKMSEQSRQFGAELGLKGLQTGIQSAQALGNLGQQQGYLDLATLKQMADLGTADRNFDYNEFLRAEKYPYENLTFMKNMLTGLPISAAATGIDPMSQALTGGLSTVALIDMLNKINTGSTGTTTTSDRRLKTDIQTIGVLDDGLKVYSYRYKSGGPMQIGVMADEVAVLRPQAYIKGGAGDGFDAVDYSKL